MFQIKGWQGMPQEKAVSGACCSQLRCICSGAPSQGSVSQPLPRGPWQLPASSKSGCVLTFSVNSVLPTRSQSRRGRGLS